MARCRVALTSDFRRFYGLTLPDDIRQVSPQALLDLLDGLTGIDGSLYREYRLDHDELDTGTSGDGDGYRLSNHAFTQDTMLLADMRNMLAAQFNSQLKKGAPGVPMVMMPGEQGKRRKSGHLSLADMQFVE